MNALLSYDTKTPATMKGFAFDRAEMAEVRQAINFLISEIGDKSKDATTIEVQTAYAELTSLLEDACGDTIDALIANVDEALER